MKPKYIFLLLSVTWISMSCNKFLGIKPKGILIPELIGDYEAMLNASTMNNTFAINLLDFTDDNFNKLDALNQSATANGYYWRHIITTNEKASPEIWGPLYRCIYNANVIIKGAPDAPDGTPEKKKQVVGEALLIRAVCHMELLTVFAKAYNAATAATDPGLPLVTSTSVTDKVPGRSSLKATIDGMIADINTAIEGLPLNNVNRYRVTKYVAYGLLSRIYLYMADYANAKKYTDMALQAPHTLLNYNSYAAKTGVPVYDLNPEILWQRGAVSGSPNFMLYSDDLKSYFNSTDIRYTFLTVTNNNGLGRSPFSGRYSFGIGFPEMYLTQAELLARDGKYADAIKVVNMLRKNRVTTASYVEQTATSVEDALAKVFAERRRELAYSGLRWFDMKRLDREGRMPAVRRISPDTQAVDAILEPGSPKYTFEIPVRVQMFNPSMQLNHK